jgi:multidrug efflux pump subunit AcrB
MSFLYSSVSIQMGWLIAAAVVAACLLALWISALLSRRLFVTIKKSEETEFLAFHLRRIADALERLAVARESQNQPSLDTSTGRTASTPTFGH